MNTGAVRCRITGNSNKTPGKFRPATSAGFEVEGQSPGHGMTSASSTPGLPSFSKSDFIRRFSYNYKPEPYYFGMSPYSYGGLSRGSSASSRSQNQLNLLIGNQLPMITSGKTSSETSGIRKSGSLTSIVRQLPWMVDSKISPRALTHHLHVPTSNHCHSARFQLSNFTTHYNGIRDIPSRTA